MGRQRSTVVARHDCGIRELFLKRWMMLMHVCPSVEETLQMERVATLENGEILVSRKEGLRPTTVSSASWQTMRSLPLCRKVS